MSETLPLERYQRLILNNLHLDEPDDYTRRFIAYYYANNISLWHATEALRDYMRTRHD